MEQSLHTPSFQMRVRDRTPRDLIRSVARVFRDCRDSYMQEQKFLKSRWELSIPKVREFLSTSVDWHTDWLLMSPFRFSPVFGNLRLLSGDDVDDLIPILKYGEFAYRRFRPHLARAWEDAELRLATSTSMGT